MYRNYKKNEDEIVIINRGKIAYLHMNNMFEERIEIVDVNGNKSWAWVFKRNEDLKELIKEYNENQFLKDYNSCFKNIAYDLARIKSIQGIC